MEKKIDNRQKKILSPKENIRERLEKLFKEKNKTIKRYGYNR